MVTASRPCPCARWALPLHRELRLPHSHFTDESTGLEERKRPWHRTKWPPQGTGGTAEPSLRYADASPARGA